MYNLWNENETPLLNIDNPVCVPNITPYIKEGAKGAVVVCPGGGYAMKAPHEGEPIAKFFNDCGLSAFVLDYRVSPDYKFPSPLLDAKRAVRYIRYNKDKFGIDEDKIGICGFSAGGHLAALTLTSFEDELNEYNVNDEIDKASSKVNFAVLCYPVLSFAKNASHLGSFVNLCGDDIGLMHNLSIEDRVTNKTAPVFMWHTTNDNVVPVKGTVLLTEQLINHNVPFEFHVFRDGNHGLGLAHNNPDVAEWTKLCKTWLINMGFSK